MNRACTLPSAEKAHKAHEQSREVKRDPLLVHDQRQQSATPQARIPVDAPDHATAGAAAAADAPHWTTIPWPATHAAPHTADSKPAKVAHNEQKRSNRTG